MDVVVIAAGLLFGYRLVANYLSPHPGGGPEPLQRPLPEIEVPPAPPWFEVLGVAEDAALADIERAYRAKISQYHPDKVALMGEDIRQLAEAKSKDINVAYEIALKWRKR
nr:J domain-containing protein [Dyella mobilis]